MNELLVDTSVWINYLNGVENWQTNLLSEYIQSNKQVHITPTILQEVLQGIREASVYNKVKTSLLGFNLLNWSPNDAAIYAADIYRELRKKGITIRRANDCLIAAFALHFELPLLHDDQDFTQIDILYPLQVPNP